VWGVAELEVIRNDPDYAGAISVAGDMNYEAYESHDAETFDPVTDLYWPFTAFGIKASYPTFDIKRMLTPPLLARYKEVTTKGCWYYAYAALKDLGPPRPGALLPLLTAGCQHQASQPAMRRIGVEAWVPHPRLVCASVDRAWAAIFRRPVSQP
jgi:hypothetical protein